MPVVDLELLPPQYDFFFSESPEILYSGAWGAGKSLAICHKLVSRASNPKAREGLCRKHLVTLKDTTLRTLLDGDGETPPVLPPGTYDHHKSDKTITIRNAGQIVYFGLDDMEKIGSKNLTGCAVDEAAELEERDWTWICGRPGRSPVKGVKPQVYAACNPSVPSHFLATRFGLAGGKRPQPGCEAIQTKTVDNWFLPAAYIEKLSNLSGVVRKRYFEGLWVGSDGLVYDNWDRTIHVRQRAEEWRRIVIGQDSGYTHPAVMVVIAHDGDGRKHILEEWVKAKQAESAVIAAARAINERHHPEVFVVDSEDAGLIAAMKIAGLPTRAAEKGAGSVWNGIQLVRGLLDVAGDGKPRLTVDPSCINTINEFESYEWLPNPGGASGYRDEPCKQYDDAMDSLRYGITYTDAPRQAPLLR